jgi:hypothetical protein
MMLDKEIQVAKSGSYDLVLSNTTTYSDDIEIEGLFQPRFQQWPAEPAQPIHLMVEQIEAVNVNVNVYFNYQVFDGATGKEYRCGGCPIGTSTPNKVIADFAFFPVFQGSDRPSYEADKFKISWVTSAAVTSGKVRIYLRPVKT